MLKKISLVFSGLVASAIASAFIVHAVVTVINNAEVNDLIYAEIAADAAEFPSVKEKVKKSFEDGKITYKEYSEIKNYDKNKLRLEKVLGNEKTEYKPE